MSAPKTAEERIAAAKAQRDNAPAYPLIRNAEAVTAPAPFDGEWMHTSGVGAIIESNGWKPDLITNTIYGAAVYLSRGPWDPRHASQFSCVLALTPNEVLFEFTSKKGSGRGQDEFLWHVGERTNSLCGRNPSPGFSAQNQRIKNYFLNAGIKAVHVLEHGREVVAVYDPNVIRVVNVSHR